MNRWTKLPTATQGGAPDTILRGIFRNGPSISVLTGNPLVAGLSPGAPTEGHPERRGTALRILPLLIPPLLLYPNESRADAINPLINLFTPDTAVPASILTVLIILLEALLLQWWLRSVSFRWNLWRATIINLVSGAAGSLVAPLFFQEEMPWGTAGLFISMFFLSLATETPTLKLLYRREGVGWPRSIKISIGLNLISYLFVFVAQFALVFAYLGYAGLADRQTIKKWNDRSLLEKETGYIYTVKYSPSERFSRYVFNRYDVAADRWETVDPGFERGVYPSVWDVKGDRLVCVIETGDWKNRYLSIGNASSFTPGHEIKGNFRDVRVSPDGSKIAALEYVGEVGAPRDEESYFMLGSACRLKVFDGNSGMLLHESPRLTLNAGLSWTRDSGGILFSSLRDETLFNKQRDDFPPHGYGRGYAEEGRFPIDIFVFDLKTNSIKNLVEGRDPRVISSTGNISFLKEKGMSKREIWQLNPDTGTSGLIAENIGGHQHAVSPGGNRYLIQVPHKQPLGGGYFLTAVDPANPKRKFILEPNSRYGFRWTLPTTFRRD
jgi:hypothetical protein